MAAQLTARKWLLTPAIAVMINGAGDKFLARAAFTGDQRGRVADGDLADEFENLLHRLAAPDDAQFIIFGFQQRLVGNDLFHIARGLEGVGDDLLDFYRVKRLEQIVIGTEFHRFNGHLRRAIGSHEDDEQLGVASAARFCAGFRGR